MRAYRSSLLLLGMAIFLVGCAQERTSAPKAHATTEGDVAPSATKDWTEIREFKWDDTAIRCGMTKDQVLLQVAKSSGRFGIRRPSREMIQQDVWRLSCGTSTGAAPGYAGVRIMFRLDKVIRLEEYTGPQPA